MRATTGRTGGVVVYYFNMLSSMSRMNFTLILLVLTVVLLTCEYYHLYRDAENKLVLTNDKLRDAKLSLEITNAMKPKSTSTNTNKKASTSKSKGTILSKISNTSEYLTFPGFSVVGPIVNNGGDNNLLFYKLFDQLNSSDLIKEYFGLLPPDSYHITIINIEVKSKKTESQWSNWFGGEIDRLVEAHKLFSKQGVDFGFRIGAIGKDCQEFLYYNMFDFTGLILFPVMDIDLKLAG